MRKGTTYLREKGKVVPMHTAGAGSHRACLVVHRCAPWRLRSRGHRLLTAPSTHNDGRFLLRLLVVSLVQLYSSKLYNLHFIITLLRPATHFLHYTLPWEFLFWDAAPAPAFSSGSGFMIRSRLRQAAEASLTWPQQGCRCRCRAARPAGSVEPGASGTAGCC